MSCNRETRMQMSQYHSANIVTVHGGQVSHEKKSWAKKKKLPYEGKFRKAQIMVSKQQY